MRKLRDSCAALAVCAAALALAGAADAAVSFYSFGTGTPPLQTITNFSNDTAGVAPTWTPNSSYSWSGSGVILDTTSGDGAEPAVAGGGYGTGNYMSIEGGDSELLTIPAAAGYKDIALYVGSLDSYNGLTFTLAGGATVSYSGSQLGVISGAANGDQTAANTNGVFYFDFAAPVTSIEFQSGSNSFEIASISANVPEPATWAMLIAGIAMIGFAVRRRREGLTIGGASLTAA